MRHLRTRRSLGWLLSVLATVPLIVRCSSNSDAGLVLSGGVSGSSAGASNQGGISAHAGAGGSEGNGRSGSSNAGSGGSAAAGTNTAGARDTAGASGSGGDAGSGGSAAGNGGSADNADTSGGMSGSAGYGGMAGMGGSSSIGGASGMSAGGHGGAGGSGGGSESSGATQGPLTLSATHLYFALHCPGELVFTPQTIALTNTGGTALTWAAKFTPVYFDVSPATTTLAPNAHVDVTVVVKYSSVLPLNPTRPTDPGDITITTDFAGDVTHTLAVSETTDGYVVVMPDDIDFGNVPVGTSVKKMVGPLSTVGGALGSSNPDFLLSGLAPGYDGAWSLTFTPSQTGLESTTLTMGIFQGCVFPPNTFTATGTGI